MSTQKFTEGQVVEALRECRGMVYNAAAALGCSHQSIYNYIARYESVSEALEEERGKFLDVAELKLLEAVEAGAPWAVAFTLKTIGKNRGYTERHELALPEDTDVRSMSDEELQAIVDSGHRR